MLIASEGCENRKVERTDIFSPTPPPPYYLTSSFPFCYFMLVARPNFLIIGAAKSGTTALYQALRQHPQIFMSAVKEPHYFAFAGERMDYRGPGVTINETSVTDLREYERLFAGVTDETAAGEASALYLYVPQAVRRIYEYAPGMRLIAILRQPAERAFSAFMHLTRDAREPCGDFADALRAEPERIAQNWGFLWRYTDLGFYAQQLRRYYTAFPAGQIRVFLYDDFRRDALGTAREAFRFLGVDDGFAPDLSARPKMSGAPRSRWLHDFLRGPHPLARAVLPASVRERAKLRVTNQNLARRELPAEMRRELTQVFRDDILQLQDLIGRDLSAWLA